VRTPPPNHRRAALPRTFAVFTLAAFAAAGLAACGKGSNPADEQAAAEKSAHEAAIADLKQPIALISGYAPYAVMPEKTDKWAPARHIDLDKSTLCASNEIRYAANKARQKLETSSAEASKGVQAALRSVTEACADADEPDKLTKCAGAVKALDGALEKTSAAAAAMGVAGKYPRVAPESVTDEARKSMDTFLRARGPGAAEKAYVEKRADPKATPNDVIAACQAAQGDADAAASTFEKADEPIRLTAATRKMARDSQCRRLDELSKLNGDMTECGKDKKKAKTTECKIICGKVKNWLEDGLPAAAFTPIEKDHADICAKL
jgi:hypothetical protein